MRPTTFAIALFAAALTLPALGADDAVTLESLQQQLAAQQAEIDALAAKLAAESDNKDLGGSTGDSHFGGYGELHYNALDSGKEMDFHRFVLFFSHQFSDEIRFFSEVELEHSVAEDGANGAFELEQAYIEFNLTPSTWVTAGVFLLPVGITNETHEPTTFYGVERNPIENRIIPTTWREGGVMVSGRLGDAGFGYDLAITSGLMVDSTFTIRDGRQHVSEAVAEELAATARIKYTGVAGLELAASVTTQPDITQGLVAGAGAGTLLSTHAKYENGRFSTRVLWAGWSLDGAAPAAIEKDEQDGAYAEVAWKLLPTLGVFGRYNLWDEGGAGATERSQSNLGLNWWPHPNVVVKLDVQDQGKAIDDDGFNLGIGYRF